MFGKRRGTVQLMGFVQEEPATPPSPLTRDDQVRIAARREFQEAKRQLYERYHNAQALEADQADQASAADPAGGAEQTP
jgi:hypothetical protein